MLYYSLNFLVSQTNRNKLPDPFNIFCALLLVSPLFLACGKLRVEKNLFFRYNVLGNCKMSLRSVVRKAG